MTSRQSLELIAFHFAAARLWFPIILLWGALKRTQLLPPACLDFILDQLKATQSGNAKDPRMHLFLCAYPLLLGHFICCSVASFSQRWKLLGIAPLSTVFGLWPALPKAHSFSGGKGSRGETCYPTPFSMPEACFHGCV